jgi:BASS family bile acid:Na+ symporter
MFNIGTTLSFNKLKEVLMEPMPLIVGLSMQMIALPLVAFVICLMSELTAQWKVGLFILSLCPGGISSNFISYLLKANTELSVTLTSINSVLTLFTIPILGKFALTYFLENDAIVDFNLGLTIFQLLIVSVIPLLVGMFVNRRYPDVARLLQGHFKLKLMGKYLKIGYLKLTTVILLVAMFGIKIFASTANGGAGLSQSDATDLAPTIFLFNIMALAMGYIVSKLFNTDQQDAVTIGVEVGLQNTGLCFLVIGSLLDSTIMQQPALVYAMFSFWTAVVFGLIVRKSRLA